MRPASLLAEARQRCKAMSLLAPNHRHTHHLNGPDDQAEECDVYGLSRLDDLHSAGCCQFSNPGFKPLWHTCKTLRCARTQSQGTCAKETAPAPIARTEPPWAAAANRPMGASDLMSALERMGVLRMPGIHSMRVQTAPTCHTAAQENELDKLHDNCTQHLNAHFE
jgi:hypothetical protein